MFRMNKLNPQGYPKLYVIQREVKFVYSKKALNSRKIDIRFFIERYLNITFALIIFILYVAFLRSGLFLHPLYFYFAYSTALVSLITFTLICPGYSSSLSIFLTMSRAISIVLSSLISSGLTMILTSRPA